jgi:HD-GYP domain-containing protein (c-di-GMP phosphodiesterase class II)
MDERSPDSQLLEESTSRALLAALETHDPYTARHSHSVVELAKAVAIQMELAEEERAKVTLVALLHDVGKLELPSSVLNKPGPLTPAERQIVEEHSAAGAMVVERVSELAHIAPAIRAGHERWDGDGYPDNLSGEHIPIASRIAFVCDAYDAMTTDRPYRRAMDHEDAVAELRRCSGTQFCERSVAALLTVLSPADA